MANNAKAPTRGKPGGASRVSSFAADHRNINTNNVIDAFRKAMLEHIGTAPDVLEADGKRHYFPTNGKHDDKAGRYILHIDSGIPAGYFEDFRAGIKRTWRAGSDLLPEMSAEERAKIHAEAEQAKARKQREQTQAHKDAADNAVNVWRVARPAMHDFPYLERKGIKPNNARFYGVALIIPMYDIYGRLWNIQRIFSDGKKRFPPGGRKRGLFSVLGGVKLADSARALVVEGWATGCTVSEIEPGTPVIVAFDAGNITHVVGAVLGKHPHLQITIVADDDRKTERTKGHNTGLEKALAVAAQYSAVSVVVPNFPVNAPIELSDINDLVSWRNNSGGATDGH